MKKIFNKFKEYKTAVNSDANLRSHLSNTHKMREFGYSSQIKLDNFDSPIEKEKKKELHEAILDAIIMDSRPFGDFRKDGMAR